METQEFVRTRLALLEVKDPWVLHLRYFPRAVVDALAVAENIRAVLALPETFATIAIVPVDVTFKPDIMDRDHYAGLGLTSGTHILAVVAEEPVFRNWVERYFLLHPPGFLFNVFTDVDHAEAWVRQCIAEQRSPMR